MQLDTLTQDTEDWSSTKDFPQEFQLLSYQSCSHKDCSKCMALDVTYMLLLNSLRYVLKTNQILETSSKSLCSIITNVVAGKAKNSDNNAQ